MTFFEENNAKSIICVKVLNFSDQSVHNGRKMGPFAIATFKFGTSTSHSAKSKYHCFVLIYPKNGKVMNETGILKLFYGQFVSLTSMCDLDFSGSETGVIRNISSWFTFVHRYFKLEGHEPFVAHLRPEKN